MAQYTLIGIGEILWDEFPGSRQLGGAPANFAFHASGLGARGMVISSIGDDLQGREIEVLLEKSGVSSLLSRDPDHPTGRVSVRADKKGVVDYIVHEDSAWDFLDYSHSFSDAGRQADAVCFGTLAQRNQISGKTIKQFIRQTKENCLKIFDINLRQQYYSKIIISELLNLADVVKFNHEELDIVTRMFSLGGEEETSCLEKLISMFGLDLIILTKGKGGSRIFADRGNDSVYKPEPIQMIDSVGAGDSFTAAVALGLLMGFSLEKINRTASSVASYVCLKRGATPAIPAELFLENTG
ncbi:MAG: hypothetical protein BA866_06355 [Desulfobulbaceae bacterium S5133MH15]|nr:MAG: hypothetical protein BA866_06355 [Desulfobulbaceae bacterium S5133MH15]